MRKEIKIEGMKCENCEKHVKKELEKLDGVVIAKVDRSKNRAIVKLSHDIEDQIFIDQIKNNTNFKVTNIKKLLF